MAKSLADIQDQLDIVLDDVSEAKGTLESAYTPEATHEDLAVAIGVLDIRADYESSEGDEDDDDLDDEDDDPRLANPPAHARNWRKPTEEITDRAKRYHAQKAIGNKPKRCALCGSTRFLVIDHCDGDESNGAPGNLPWLCKSCNTRRGAAMARAAQRVRTRQYNPGADNLAQYTLAVTEHRRGPHDAADEIIHETPREKRREFAREIWDRRRSRGTDSSLPEWAR